MSLSCGSGFQRGSACRWGGGTGGSWASTTGLGFVGPRTGTGLKLGWWRADGGGDASRPPRSAASTASPRSHLHAQGEFGGGEPVASVMAWVADALCDPLNTYDLVRPDRVTLAAGMGSVHQAQLTPSIVLNFRWTGDSSRTMSATPALREDLLRSADAEPA